jgi:hypothetical protein
MYQPSSRSFMSNFFTGQQIPAVDSKYDLAWGDERGIQSQNLLRGGNMAPVTPDHHKSMSFMFGSGLHQSRLHNWFDHGGLKDLLNSPMYMPGIIKESPRHPTAPILGRELGSTDSRTNYPPGQSGNVSITLNYNDFRPG